MNYCTCQFTELTRGQTPEQIDTMFREGEAGGAAFDGSTADRIEEEDADGAVVLGGGQASFNVGN